jgi:hypothetical protein
MGEGSSHGRIIQLKHLLIPASPSHSTYRVSTEEAITDNPWLYNNYI